MNEEEKKAIENIKEELNSNEFLPRLVFQCEDIEKIVNLIEKQQNELDIIKTNYEILQGEMDRIGIDTLKLEKGSSTDDVIYEIVKQQTELIETKEANRQLAKENEQLRTEVNSLEKEIEELKEKMKDFEVYERYFYCNVGKRRDECTHNIDDGCIRKEDIKKDYISKDKIREKIKECVYWEDKYNTEENMAIKSVLEELLKED